MTTPDLKNFKSPAPRARRRYAPPRLEVFGDLRDLTLGVSGGTGDSPGNPDVERSPGATEFGPVRQGPGAPPNPGAPPPPGQ